MTYDFIFFDWCFTKTTRASIFYTLMFQNKTIKSGVRRINTAIWYVFTFFHIGFLELFNDTQCCFECPWETLLLLVLSEHPMVGVASKNFLIISINAVVPFELSSCGSCTDDLFQRHDKEMTSLDSTSGVCILVYPAILLQFVFKPMHLA